jgi:hypothetical protein
LLRISRKERETCCVPTLGGKIEWENRTEEGVGDLKEDACSITGIDLSSGGTTMIHIAERTESMTDDLMAPLTFHVNDKVDATGIVFEPGVVEALSNGEPERA